MPIVNDGLHLLVELLILKLHSHTACKLPLASLVSPFLSSSSCMLSRLRESRPTSHTACEIKLILFLPASMFSSPVHSFAPSSSPPYCYDFIFPKSTTTVAFESIVLGNLWLNLGHTVGCLFWFARIRHTLHWWRMNDLIFAL